MFVKIIGAFDFDCCILLDIWLLAALLVKQIFKQEVVWNVTTLEPAVCARADASWHIFYARFHFKRRSFLFLQSFACALRKDLFSKHIFYLKIGLGIIVKIYFKNISNLFRFGSILCLWAGCFFWVRSSEAHVTGYLKEGAKPSFFTETNISKCRLLGFRVFVSLVL